MTLSDTAATGLPDDKKALNKFLIPRADRRYGRKPRLSQTHTVFYHSIPRAPLTCSTSSTMELNAAAKRMSAEDRGRSAPS